MELALVENLQREDLNLSRPPRLIRALLDSLFTKEQLAERLGRATSVTNTLRLTRLPALSGP